MASSTEPTSRVEGPARPPLEIGVVSLFPELFVPFFDKSFVGRARQSGIVSLSTFPLREHGLGRHLSVDDTPYGGGSGMVLRVDCVVRAIESAEEQFGGRSHRVLLTPQGAQLTAARAQELSHLALSGAGRLLFICGRYEGFDERVRRHVDEELSIGDVVLTGGEIPAMAAIEALIRFLPGVLGNVGSVHEESFSDSLDGGLEYPQYTRPLTFRGDAVPEVLTSGDHGKIKQWRLQSSREKTLARRPDLASAGAPADSARSERGPSGPIPKAEK